MPYAQQIEWLEKNKIKIHLLFTNTILDYGDKTKPLKKLAVQEVLGEIEANKMIKIYGDLLIN